MKAALCRRSSEYHPDFLVFAAAVPKLTGAKIILDMHELMPELYATKYGIGTHHPLVRLVTAAERLAVGFADASSPS